MLREEVTTWTTFLCTNLRGQKYPLIIKIERLVALTRINSVNQDELLDNGEET